MSAAEILEERADQLVADDESYLTALVSIRRSRGPSVELVAERMSVSPETVRELERYDANPTLSVLRRYALAVGAQVTHRVDVLPEIVEPSEAEPELQA